MHSKLLLAGSAVVLLASGQVAAQDRSARADVVKMSAQGAAGAAETIAIDMHEGSRSIWSGSLRIGPQYGNASFSQSTNEFAAPCPGEPTDMSGSNWANTSISFNISRRNWQQQPDSFNVNLNRVTPVPACSGEGTNTTGFSRVIDLPPNQAVTVSGDGSLSVRLTRMP